MQTGSGTKNPPWARSNVNSNMTGMNPQIMDANSMMSQQGMMPFQQSQAVYNNMMQAQGGMAMPMAGQMQMNSMNQSQMYPGNVVAYPTPRAMNPGMYGNAQTNQTPANAEQRVFTGTVTKTHNDFGFVDHDVFYQTSVCAKGIVPKVNDRVLVEATYNPNMPFKWNATRVQVLPKGGPNQKQNAPKSNTYNAVPPPSKANKQMPPRRDDRGRDSLRRDNVREDRKRSRTRTRSRSRDRRDSRNRRDSPPRKRPVIHQPSPAKYVVRVPRMPLDIQKLDVPALSQRYTNLYIPSDFFNAQVKWGETFPPQMPFSINNPCSYHIMKDVENPNGNDAVLEPPDSDYRFSAKVMLISMPTLESLYQKCGLTKTDDKDKRSSLKSALHPTRLIKFLVGQKGKGGENFAIGGPWSPSLDGEHPDTDPSVLVRTAIRTCKALTGLDLSTCTQWYRMVEFYYWREGSGGRSRLECVVLFLPDVWSAQPSRVEWATIQDHYKAACDAALRRLDGEEPAPAPAATPAPSTATDDAAAPAPAAADAAEISIIENQDANDSTITIEETDDEVTKLEPTHYSKLDLKTIKVDQLRQELKARKVNNKGVRATLVSRLSKLLKAEEESENQKTDDVMEVEDEPEKPPESKEESTDTKEKESEKPKEEKDEKKDNEEKEDKKEEKKEEVKKEKTEKEIEEEKKKIEKEKQQLKLRYELPSEPHMVIHPDASAKGGKFTCSVATLSLLLDYRQTDNKEHSFELFVFAELFNEMLMRDFGFYIYKTLYTLPEKAEEVKDKEKEKSAEKPKEGEKKDEKKDEAKVEKEKKEGEKDKKEVEKDKKEGEKEKEKKEEKEKEGEKKKDEKEKESKDKKDDRRDERRESRRRDRRDSHSDSSRSGSPAVAGAGAGSRGGAAGAGGRSARGRGVELPPDPYLLLSLVYFDTGRAHHLNRKDLQSLFMSLGLQLSRSQIKNILEKVCVRDNFSYKPLVSCLRSLASGGADVLQDLPLDSAAQQQPPPVPDHIAELEASIARGNRELLPVFDRHAPAARTDRTDSGTAHTASATVDVSDTGVVMYKSRLVDVGALVAAESRSATTRTKLEEALHNTRRALSHAQRAAATTAQAERGAQNQLSDVSTNLQHARARIASLTASSKIFHSALKSIQAKVEAVVNIKYEDDDVVEVLANGPKAEKDVKPEKPEAVKTDTKSVKEEKEVKDTDQKEKEIDDTNTENMEIADDKE